VCGPFGRGYSPHYDIRYDYTDLFVCRIIVFPIAAMIVSSRSNRDEIAGSYSPVVLSSRRRRHRKPTFSVNFIEIVGSKSLLFPIGELYQRRSPRADVKPFRECRAFSARKRERDRKTLAEALQPSGIEHGTNGNVIWRKILLDRNTWRKWLVQLLTSSRALPPR